MHKDTVAEHSFRNLEDLYEEDFLDRKKYTEGILKDTSFVTILHDFGKSIKFKTLPDQHALEGSVRVEKILINDFGLMGVSISYLIIAIIHTFLLSVILLKYTFNE